MDFPPEFLLKLVVAVCPPVLASASIPSTPAPASTCDLSLDLPTAPIDVGGGLLKGSTSWYYGTNSQMSISMRCTDIVCARMLGAAGSCIILCISALL